MVLRKGTEFTGGPWGVRVGGRGFLGKLSSGGTSITEFRFALEENAGRVYSWGNSWMGVCLRLGPGLVQRELAG